MRTRFLALALLTLVVSLRAEASVPWESVVDARLGLAPLDDDAEAQLRRTRGFASIRAIPDAVDVRAAFGNTRLRGLQAFLEQDRVGPFVGVRASGTWAGVGVVFAPCELDDTCGLDGSPVPTIGITDLRSALTPETRSLGNLAPASDRPFAGSHALAVDFTLSTLLGAVPQGFGEGFAPATIGRAGLRLTGGHFGPDAGGFELQSATHGTLRGLGACDATSCPDAVPGWANATGSPFVYEVANRPALDFRLSVAGDVPLLYAPTAQRDSGFLADVARASVRALHAIPAIVVTPFVDLDAGFTTGAVSAGAIFRAGLLRVHHGLGVEQRGAFEFALVGGAEVRGVGWDAAITAPLATGLSTARPAALVAGWRAGLEVLTPWVDVGVSRVQRTPSVEGSSGDEATLRLTVAVHAP